MDRGVRGAPTSPNRVVSCTPRRRSVPAGGGARRQRVPLGGSRRWTTCGRVRTATRSMFGVRASATAATPSARVRVRSMLPPRRRLRPRLPRPSRPSPLPPSRRLHRAGSRPPRRRASRPPRLPTLPLRLLPRPQPRHRPSRRRPCPRRSRRPCPSRLQPRRRQLPCCRSRRHRSWPRQPRPVRSVVAAATPSGRAREPMATPIVPTECPSCGRQVFTADDFARIAATGCRRRGSWPPTRP